MSGDALAVVVEELLHAADDEVLDGGEAAGTFGWTVLEVGSRLDLVNRRRSGNHFRSFFGSLSLFFSNRIYYLL